MPRDLADWQLPPGVDRGLWDYLHSSRVAEGYDAGLAGSSLFRLDVPFVLEWCAPAGRLIDLGCGTGRALAPLGRAGHRVTGVDLSPTMLGVARQRLAAEGAAADLVRANLTRLGCFAPASFDHAACLFSTLGMVAGEGPRREVLAHVHRLLRPGGRFVLHAHNYWFNARDPAGRRWLLGDLLAGGRGDRPMPVHQGVAGLSLHHFTRREAVRLLRAAGFRVLEVRPLSLRDDGRLPLPWMLPRLRAYGFLIAAERE